MTTPALTLADVSIPIARCSGCSQELPLSAPTELFSTPASQWIVATCPTCKRCTPFRLEKAEVIEDPENLEPWPKLKP
jgi:hypothetical protein